MIIKRFTKEVADDRKKRSHDAKRAISKLLKRFPLGVSTLALSVFQLKTHEQKKLCAFEPYVGVNFRRPILVGK